MWGPLGAGFSKNSAAVDAAYKKLSALGREDSLKDVCFRCCYCRPFVVSGVITGLTRCVQFQRSSELSPVRKHPRLSRPIQTPIVALHSQLPWDALHHHVHRGYTDEGLTGEA